MIPFYIFYSMFGFQRTGDQAWAFGDARGRGFMMGATAGRTTLHGEGLQHDDGHSHLLAGEHPEHPAYDPAFAYEMAAIVRDGIERMYGKGEDVFYYVTLYNENYPQPPKPEGIDEAIVRGLYRLARGARGRRQGQGGARVRGSSAAARSSSRSSRPRSSSPSSSGSRRRSTRRRRSRCSAATRSRSTAGTGSTRRERRGCRT